MKFLYRVFIQGLLTSLPILITLYLLAWIASKAEGTLGEPLRQLLPAALYFPGEGVLIGVLFIFIVGILANNYLTGQFLIWLEERLQQVPFFKAVYSPIRDVMNLFAHSEKEKSQRAVLVELPGVGASVMGLVTRDRFDDFPENSALDNKLVVFVPFSYAVGGYTLVVPKSQVKELGISAEKAMQLSITAWVKGEKRPHS